jgi:transcriptional accessory protein Tex/SPT6
LSDLEDRRKAILDSIKAQDKLTPQLEGEIDHRALIGK